MKQHHITPDRIELARLWLAERGGIAIWKSINLSNPGASWMTPATIKRKDCNGAPAGLPEDELPYPKPTWQVGNNPDMVITDACDIIVDIPKEFKRFHVGLRRSYGTSVKLTDASNKKLKKAISDCFEKTGKVAWYEFDYEAQDVIILYADSEKPLSEIPEHENKK